MLLVPFSLCSTLRASLKLGSVPASPSAAWSSLMITADSETNISATAGAGGLGLGAGRLRRQRRRWGTGGGRGNALSTMKSGWSLSSA